MKARAVEQTHQCFKINTFRSGLRKLWRLSAPQKAKEFILSIAFAVARWIV
jgi:hypothetical protein